jgi:hypothetical protein
MENRETSCRPAGTCSDKKIMARVRIAPKRLDPDRLAQTPSWPPAGTAAAGDELATSSTTESQQTRLPLSMGMIAPRPRP